MMLMFRRSEHDDQVRYHFNGHRRGPAALASQDRDAPHLYLRAGAL